MKPINLVHLAIVIILCIIGAACSVDRRPDTRPETLPDAIGIGDIIQDSAKPKFINP